MDPWKEREMEMFIYMCVCTHTYTCIYIYIYSNAHAEVIGYAVLKPCGKAMIENACNQFVIVSIVFC